MALLSKLEAQLVEGKSVGIHCRQGIGRSGLLAASLLILGGVPLEAALDRVKIARGCAVPETAEQREWVARFAQDHLAALPPR
jgi:protein-tyrosine phosphatase